MKRFSTILITALCVLLIASNSFAAPKETWISVHSKNFMLVGNASEREIKQVATRLEQFRDVFTRLLPNANFTSPVPTTVIVFKSDSSYKPFKPLYNGKPASVAGYFQPGEDVNYITLTTEQGQENPYHTIFHEYVHLLVNNTLSGPPAWFNEGLAEYYSTFEVSDGDKKAMLGKVQASHVLRLREQKLLPLQTLFAVDHNSPLYNEKDKQSIFYAQSWALVHYLILGSDGQRAPQLGQFLNMLTAGMSIENAFRQAFQTDFAAIEKELKQYIQRDSFPAKVATFSQKLEFDKEMQVAAISEAEAQFYLGDLLLHTNRLDEAEARLKQALALDANLTMANASLGILRMRQKNFAEARQLLQRAVAANSQNYLAHYYYAYAVSREGMDENQMVSSYTPEAAALMRAELKKAIELAPTFPESYHLLAFVNIVMDDQLDEAAAMLKRAMQISPGRPEFSFMLAQVYMRKRDFKTARQLLEPLSRSSADPQMRQNAQSLLNAITSFEEQMGRRNSQGDASTSNGGERPTLGRRNPTGKTGAQPEGSAPTAPADPSSYLQEALRVPRDGEQRVQGTLVRIDCDAKGVWFIVKAGERTLKFHGPDFENIDLTNYTTGGVGDLSCGPRPPDNFVIVSFRPSTGGRVKADGEVSAIEFVPKDFKLKQ